MKPKPCSAVVGDWPRESETAQRYMREARRLLRAHGVTIQNADGYIVWMGSRAYDAVKAWLHPEPMTCERAAIMHDQDLALDAIEIAKRTRKA